MGLFTKLFDKPIAKPETILAMVLLEDKDSYFVERLIEDFQQHYTQINDLAGDDISAVVMIDGEQLALMNIDRPVPFEDIENTAQYAYNWRTAVEDLKDHQAHIIIALIDGTNDLVKRFRIQTKAICAVLRTTNAIGVYNGNQSLLIPKDVYLNYAQLMDSRNLPLFLWIYIGLRTVDGSRNGYTYGLKAFGKHEVEIVDSDKSLSEIREMLYNIAHYVLLNDVNFKEGQTFGHDQDQKVKIGYSKGAFVEGKSYKLLY